MDRRKAGDAARRVVVVDDDHHTSSYFKKILQSTNDFELAGDFSNADDALTKVPFLRPHLVLLGILLSGGNGIEWIRRLKQILIGLKVITVLGASGTDLVESCLQAGADACLVKPISVGQCVATLQCACFCRIPNELEPPHFSLAPRHRTTAGDCLPLSRRENEVMRCFAEGLLYKEIPDRLGLSYSAVRKYQQKIFRKFHVANRSEAIRAWLGNNPSESGDSRRSFFRGCV